MNQLPRSILLQQKQRLRAKLAAVEAAAFASDGTPIHPRLLDEYQRRERATVRYADNAEDFLPDIRRHFGVVLAAVAAGRAELIRLQREGKIEDEVLHDLERDLDLEELGARFQLGEEDGHV